MRTSTIAAVSALLASMAAAVPDQHKKGLQLYPRASVTPCTTTTTKFVNKTVFTTVTPNPDQTLPSPETITSSSKCTTGSTNSTGNAAEPSTTSTTDSAGDTATSTSATSTPSSTSTASSSSATSTPSSTSTSSSSSTTSTPSSTSTASSSSSTSSAPSSTTPPPPPPSTDGAAGGSTPGGSESEGANGKCVEGTPCEGEITYWYPGGQNFCGGFNTAEERIVALPFGLMTGEPHFDPLCGKTVKLTLGGKETMAKVVDKCGSCPGEDIDLSPVVFQELAELVQGRVPGVKWWFVD
ncbi:MAG: hypothetical protein M1837_004754 [Sclerophora amabilis]|nr:MAG: hypothetical protein M1837_004754 [Sclerophora amabilis]